MKASPRFFVVYCILKARLLLKPGLCVLLAAMSMAASLHAQTIADFAGGNGTSSHDQYAGTSGGGWAGAWVENQSADVNATVTNASPLLPGQGNYLSVTNNDTSTGASFDTILRQYSSANGVVLAQPHTISFDFRLDSLASQLTGTDAIALWNTNSTSTDTSGDNGFQIRATTSNGILQWLWFNGNKAGGGTFVDTGMPLTEGTVYHFSIEIDPVNKEFTAFIDNGTTIVSSGTMGYRTSSAAPVSRSYLAFGSRDQTSGQTLISSLDNLVVSAMPLWHPADLDDRLWLDWWAEGLPDGTIPQWTSRNGSVSATQTDAAQQPVKQNGEVFFANNRKLILPAQGKANLAHRAVMVLFRVDLSGSGSGSIFTVNGVSGGSGRQPFVGYNRSTNTVIVQWQTPGDYNRLDFAVPEDANQWHCLVSRRVGDTHYASIDGKQVDGTTPGESQVVMADWAMDDSAVTGNLGDYRTATPPMAIDTVLVVQDELGIGEAQKLMGWGMWRRGIQSQLPASHPYRNVPPLYSEPDYVFTESSSAEWDDLMVFWNNHALSEQYKNTPIDLTGWNLVFEDEFNTHTVTHDVRGRGNWFAPTHGAPCGAATAVRPDYNAGDPTVGTTGTPATYIQSASSMTIRMQNSGGWKSGAFCSVNKNGYGRTWMYPYIEARMKIGPSSTGSTKGAWPAVWLKSENFFYNLCESYLEYDIYEGYISDNDGFHNSLHNWPASRKLSDRLQEHRWESNYLGTRTPGWYQNVNLFDGQYHTYGVMVTPDYVINVLDGHEMFRFPTPVEMKQPLWSLVDLALSSSEASQASGIYDLTVDYIRVYQNPEYDE
jgi:hypothetical protein